MTLRESPLIEYFIHKEVDGVRKGRHLQPTPVGRPSSCRYPHKVVHPDTGLVLYVPCHSCLPCRIQRRDAWFLRLQMEAQEHERSSFLTLTYKDVEGRDFYEWDDAHGRDSQLYMKRLRKELSRRGDAPIRFFRVTEQGEKTGRYHHHLVIFGRACEVRGGLGGHHQSHGPWSLGFTEDQPATLKAMRYVCRYVTKAFVDADDLDRNLTSRSKGLGLAGCHRLGFALGEVMAKAGRPAVVPGRVPIGMPGWKIKRERARGRDPGLPLIGRAREAFAQGVTDAGAEVVPDVVPWMDPLVARALDRDPERLERERARAVLDRQTDDEARVNRAREHFTKRRL